MVLASMPSNTNHPPIKSRVMAASCKKEVRSTLMTVSLLQGQSSFKGKSISEFSKKLPWVFTTPLSTLYCNDINDIAKNSYLIL